MNAQRLLVARQPNTGATIGIFALDLHAIQLFLKSLGVLLDLLRLAEGFGELTEIGESEACHRDSE
jgi:hypothetical protein